MIFIFASLLKKDFRNLKNSFLPALLMGLPLILVLGMSAQNPSTDMIHWRSAFWVVFFVSSTALLYRSFEQENRSKNYSLYFSIRLPRFLIFLSQSLVQWISCIFLSGVILALVAIFWSPNEAVLSSWGWAILLSAGLCPLGCLLSLLLQFERDFLFALFYLPLASPALLAGYHLSIGYQASWLYALLIFCCLSAFLAAFLFEFFFDELIENH
jgi:ABC-type transport system involved in cytochrome c biogenesis permease component